MPSLKSERATRELPIEWPEGNPRVAVVTTGADGDVAAFQHVNDGVANPIETELFTGEVLFYVKERAPASFVPSYFDGKRRKAGVVLRGKFRYGVFAQPLSVSLCKTDINSILARG